jgi:hypothetical protein
MPQAEPAEVIVQGREPGKDAEAPRALGPKLGERDVRRGRDQPSEVGLIPLQQGTPMPAIASRGGAAGRPHPLHELDGGRRADGEPPRRLADRAAPLDRTHDPQAQVHGNRSRHLNISAVSTDIVESQL